MAAPPAAFFLVTGNDLDVLFHHQLILPPVNKLRKETAFFWVAIFF